MLVGMSPVATVFDVIAEPTRRRILDAVRDGERSVGELVDEVGMHQPGVSRHLKVLRDAGLVEVRQDAQRRLYRLRPEPLMELDAWLEPYRARVGEPARLARAPPASAPPPRSTPLPIEPHQKDTHVNDPTDLAYDGVVERTADGGVIRFERHLPYPIRDVWNAITDPERLADWWLPFDADITVDLREGGEMRFVGRGEEPVDDDAARSCGSRRRCCSSTPTSTPTPSCAGSSKPTDTGCTLRLSHFVTDADAAIENCYVVGLHTSLARLEPLLAGRADRLGLGRRSPRRRPRYAELGFAPEVEAS